MDPFTLPRGLRNERVKVGGMSRPRLTYLVREPDRSSRYPQQAYVTVQNHELPQDSTWCSSLLCMVLRRDYSAPKDQLVFEAPDEAAPEYVVVKQFLKVAANFDTKEREALAGLAAMQYAHEDIDHTMPCLETLQDDGFVYMVMSLEPGVEMSDITSQEQSQRQAQNRPAQSGNAMTRSYISRKFLQHYIEVCGPAIPTPPTLVLDDTQSRKPFQMDATPRDVDGFLHRYLRQIVFGAVLTGGILLGLIFSSAGVAFGIEVRPTQPTFLTILQWLAMTITFPDWIPSVMSVVSPEPPHRFFRSDVPITMRWITRGDKNSKVTMIAVEAANKIIRDQGLDNFRLEIVSDACVSVNQYKFDGSVKMRYDPRRGTDVPDIARVKAPLVVAYERDLLPYYVNLVVVPDKFKTRAGTEKKGKALYYTSLWNKVIRSRQEFGIKIDRIVKLFHSGNMLRLRYKAARLYNEAKELKDELLLDLGEKSYYSQRRADQELRSLEEVLDGRMLELSSHLVRLPSELDRLISDESHNDDYLGSVINDLQTWSLDLQLTADERREFPFCRLDSQVYHLDEESMVSPEVLWSLNEHSQKGEHAWRLGQGHHTYADTFNTQGLTCAGFQARMAQFWDTVRTADDGHRWVTQQRILQRILIGAKGSNNKQSQAIEQKRGYGFNGGAVTNITEDACQAFNITPAMKAFRAEIAAELECLTTHYSQPAVLQYYIDASSSREVIGTYLWLEDLEMELKDIARVRGASKLLGPPIAKVKEELKQMLGQIFQLSVPDRNLIVLNIVNKLLLAIDKGYKDKLGWRDAHYLTGKVREQSPFSVVDFMLQRRRWFTGLLSLWRAHNYLGKDGHYMFRWALFGLVLLGWGIMPLSIMALIISLFTSLARGEAADPVTGVFATTMGMTYIYLYGYGTSQQFMRSTSQKLMGFLCWVTWFTQITSWLVEAPTGGLAFLAPDMTFVVVPKDRAVDDIVSEEELYPDAMYNQKALEKFREKVRLAYEKYRAIAIKAGMIISPVSLEEFLNAIPRSPVTNQS